MMRLEWKYALVESTVTRPVQDPLAVLLLDNRLFMSLPDECCLDAKIAVIFSYTQIVRLQI